MNPTSKSSIEIAPYLFVIFCCESEFLRAGLILDQFDDAIEAQCIWRSVLPSGEFETLQGIAVSALRKIQGIQPKGPYLIAGWHLGGILAYEIALQLIGSDQRVDFLGLLDTEFPEILENEFPSMGPGASRGGGGA